jgi:alanine racemase
MSSSNTATLEVDLTALRSNYQLLKCRHTGQSIAAVVKTNAYGLGVMEVSKALWQEGCTQYFVATLPEAVQLRQSLPEAVIAVLHGLIQGEEKEFLHHRLIPVLNDLAQVTCWEKATDGAATAMLHVDTGMSRLGVTQEELLYLAEHRQEFVRHLSYVISHLACSNEGKHPKNAEQLSRFRAALKALPGIKGSLANSSGLFLSADFHSELGRPGSALYGINPTQGANPMKPVARLSAPIVQIRTLDRDETIGYGATAKASKGSRIGVAALGYADGWMRCLSNKGFAYVSGHKVPLLGRISMDMITLDLSAVPPLKISSATRVELINKEQTVDDIAAACNTIGYEIFTRIGERVERRYSHPIPSS